MEFSADIVVISGALAGSVASGFAGFAFGAASLGVWAHFLAPGIAAPLVVICSLFVQLMTLPGIWRSIDYRTAAPFILGGVVGVPFGAMLLGLLEADLFRSGVGILLVLYVAAVLLARRLPKLENPPRHAALFIGLGGGVMGGFTGLSGILPTVWCSLLKWPKDRQRAIFQVFNLSMHALTLVVYGVSGTLTTDLVRPLLIALPVLVLGSYVGFKLYRRLSDHQFKAVLLGLLAFSGAALLF